MKKPLYKALSQYRYEILKTENVKPYLFITMLKWKN